MINKEQKQPDFYGERATIAKISEDPTTLQDALASTEKNEWMRNLSMQIKSGICGTAKRQKSYSKQGADGADERYKARLVTQEFPKYRQYYSLLL